MSDFPTYTAEQIRKLAQAMMDDYLPAEQGWTLVMNTRATSFVGQVKFRTRELHLCMKILTIWPRDEILDTIRHELAHALVDPLVKHGPAWRAKARELGARPQASVPAHVARTLPSPPASAKTTWLVTCGCGERGTLSRRVRDRYCFRCTEDLLWRKAGESISAAKPFVSWDF